MTKILLNMFSTEVSSNNTKQLKYITKLFNQLLKNGNITIQKTLYNSFVNNPNTERFFYIVDTLIQKQTISYENVSSHHKADQIKFMINLLELLRLFCEGHNEHLQKYMNF
jgi:RyR and IP3R Homology associated